MSDGRGVTSVRSVRDGDMLKVEECPFCGSEHWHHRSGNLKAVCMRGEYFVMAPFPEGERRP